MFNSQNLKMYLLQVILQIAVKKSLSLKKFKKNVPWTYIIFHLNNEEIVGSSHEKELQKTNQKELRIEKVIKRKGNKLYVKWKGYNNSFNSWIDKKYLIK